MIGKFSSRFFRESAESYTNETGWSPERSVPIFDCVPVGIYRPPPLNGLSSGVAAVAPSAIVPLWQLRHIRDACGNDKAP
ncbi:MAG: hypothetical protein KJ737_21410 [Proteobacteria bacterium]|nr:hypothetical protein [Pseudomonadota bacterium]